MKRIVWLTDIHLNFLLAQQVADFLRSVAAERPDAVLIGGDIAESHNVCEYLSEIERALPAPIYFVLGNHDYYHGSVDDTRRRVAALCERYPRLHFLTCDEVHSLTPQVGLVGHDGWADGRLGDYARSLVVMHDSKLIADLVSLGKEARWKVLKALGDEAGAHFRRLLPLAFARFRDVILLTHVPPFRQACWHEGQISDDQWAPHFTCQAVGQAIVEFMIDRPQNRLTVLCGHTHGSGETQPLPNVHVITGGAEYGNPTVTRVLELD
jgi:3',5'-cyclic AMP phosphodiesterase CpdA